MDDPSHAAKTAAASGHELSDVELPGLLIFLGGLVVAVLIVIVLVAWLLRAHSRHSEGLQPPPSPFTEERERAPFPLLESVEIAQLRAHEDAVLENTAWIDRQQGIARIPIDRAIALVAQQGLPRWQAPPALETTQQRGTGEPPAESQPAEVEQ